MVAAAAVAAVREAPLAPVVKAEQGGYVTIPVPILATAVAAAWVAASYLADQRSTGAFSDDSSRLWSLLEV